MHRAEETQVYSLIVHSVQRKMAKSGILHDFGNTKDRHHAGPKQIWYTAVQGQHEYSAQ